MYIEQAYTNTDDLCNTIDMSDLAHRVHTLIKATRALEVHSVTAIFFCV